MSKLNATNHINQVIYLFSHGFGDTGRQANKYMREYKTRRDKLKTNKFYIIDGETKTFNYPDTVFKPLSNIFQTSLGQENELNCLRDAYNETQEKECDVVLIGVSRGASAAATFMGACQCKRVRAVILISPFAHVCDVFKTNFFYKLFIKLSRFSETGKHPIEWLPKIDKSVPVLLVCSETDKTVPCASTIRLYKQLVDCGHAHAYLLCLKVGRHARFLKSPEAEKFQNVTHAFYKRYGLPHNEKFALLGEPFLQGCKCCLCVKKSFGFNQEFDSGTGLVDNGCEQSNSFEKLDSGDKPGSLPYGDCVPVGQNKQEASGENSLIALCASFNKHIEKFFPKK